jgi:hypothetical protein
MNSSVQIRRKLVREAYQFECLCSACVNDYQFVSLPMYQPNFKPSDLRLVPGKLPSDFKDTVKELRRHFEYTKQNFQNYPSKEHYAVQGRILNLLCHLKDVECVLE